MFNWQVHIPAHLNLKLIVPAHYDIFRVKRPSTFEEFESKSYGRIFYYPLVKKISKIQQTYLMPQHVIVWFV